MTSESLHSQGAPARRTVVAAVGGAGLALGLGACGSGGSDEADGAGGSGGSGGAGGSGGGPSSGAGAAGSDGGVLARTTDIPEGGGKVFAAQGVVVTQPVKGRFEAFSSACTHQGCAVSRVADGVISCPCHHSEFSAADGGVRKGPATRPLPAKGISVTGSEIRLT
ncbi:Rieske (2Fe-2S) protein [Streptomyces sp. SID10815]|uniref:Rieske (2Fe-2S) protein n=1 Tax=Streptomyces sp. SID10815 TaxID=2706027 RepID=UPI0013CAA36A|nr:Rieske (2Fe-2S) protein [Streptomyces sp. SID10815]NEA48362.1 Rieske (2Fe-2S) protein [Streptomyces sp. SID10815]